MKYVKRSEHVQPTFETAAKHNSITKKRASPVSMRFTEGQHAELGVFAEGQSLGTYLRDYILRGHNLDSETQKPKLNSAQKTYAQVLRQIGISGISQNLHTIRREIENSVLPADDILRKEVSRACADIASMRSELMKALGVQDRRGG